MIYFDHKRDETLNCLHELSNFVQQNQLDHSVLVEATGIAILLRRQARQYRTKTRTCAQAISLLGDVDEATERDAGYRIPRNPNLRLNTHYKSNDHADSYTRFTVDQLIQIMDRLQIDEQLQFPEDPRDPNGKQYRYHREELMAFMMDRITNKQPLYRQAEQAEYGGAVSRWEVGYYAFVHMIHQRVYHLIGPSAIRMWVPWFPYFADKIYDYILKSHARRMPDGTVVDLHLEHGHILRRQDFNTAFNLDVKASQICRTGSGPATSISPLRKLGFWQMQAAFWDPHHHMNGIKVLGGQLPNGLWGFVFGPASGQRPDDAIWNTSNLDEAIAEACINQLGRVYCGYADAIFAGWHLALRCHHVALPVLGLHLTQYQINENNLMKSVREAIEQLIAFTLNSFPLLEEWRHFKVLKNGDMFIEEIRVIYFLANCLTCVREGNVCSGRRGFNCPPPTLDEYLGGMQTYASDNL